VSGVPEPASNTQPYAFGKEAGVTDVWWPPGGRYTIKTAAEHTDGRLLQMLCTDARGAAPPLHMHPDVDETFYLIDGELTILVGDERIEAGPGDFVFGPKGVPHTYVARSEQAEFLATFAPASMDRFFEELGGVRVVPGEPAPAASYPDPVAFARGAAKWGVEIVGPPLTLE
jgi:quercetin dioxygenase-like cupin family protein